jgi:hypothetical protein
LAPNGEVFLCRRTKAAHDRRSTQDYAYFLSGEQPLHKFSARKRPSAHENAALTFD